MKIRDCISQRNRIQRIALIIVFIVSPIFIIKAYATAYWYQKLHKNEKLTYGVTFISSYAKYYDLDPRQTMLALRDDLGFRRFRLVSHWEAIEPQKGVYDFSDLDWQFKQVEMVKGKVTLSIGLRQPRWPECHAPEWVNPHNKDQWYPELKKVMAAVVERYKDSPVLDSYQLENEYLLSRFGECNLYGADRSRIQEEFDLVKRIDSNTPIIMSYANNYSGIAIKKPMADQVGVSVYKRVWDSNITKRYFDNWFPSWYYSWRAGEQQILTGKSSMLHELQAEPWTPVDTKSASIEEQNKSMNASRLKEQIRFGRQTGFKDIDLWGGEWWYWRKVKMNDNSLWEAVRTEIPKDFL